MSSAGAAVTVIVRVCADDPRSAPEPPTEAGVNLTTEVPATVGGITINSAYKLAYNNAVAGMGKSGFNLYMEDCVALNGGSAYDGSLALPTEPGDVTP